MVFEEICYKRFYKCPEKVSFWPKVTALCSSVSQLNTCVNTSICGMNRTQNPCLAVDTNSSWLLV